MQITGFYERNYGPFSNEMVELEISDNPELIQLLGTNGIGKSTLIRGFSVAGYGEMNGIVASDIANSVNGNCVVGIKTKIKGEPWRIERGFSPNFVKVYKGDNDKPEDFGGIDATKNKIKKEIMDVPWYIFSSVLSLSINDFKSFMTMQPKDSKNIRDRIFGFFVLNEMYDKVNREYLSLQSEYDTAYLSLAAKKENLDVLKKECDSLKEKIKTEIQEKLMSLKLKFDALKLEVTTVQTNLTELTKKLELALEDEVYSKLLEDNKNNKMHQSIIDELESQKNSLELQIQAKEKKLLDMNKASSEYEKYQMWLKSEDARASLVGLTDDLDLNTKELNDMASYVGAKNILLLQEELVKKNDELIGLSDKRSEFNAKYTLGKTTMVKMQDSLSTKKADLIETTKKITLFKTGVCPECETDLKGGDHIHKLEVFEARKVTLEGEIRTLSDKLITTDKQLKDGKEKVGDKLQSKITLLESDLDRIKQKMNNADLAEAQSVSDAWTKNHDSYEIAEIEAMVLTNKGKIEQIKTDIATYKAQLVDFSFDEPVKPVIEDDIVTFNNDITKLRNLHTEKVEAAVNTKNKIKPVPDDFNSEKELNNPLFAMDIPVYREQIDSINLELTTKKHEINIIIRDSNLLKDEAKNSGVKSMEEMILRSETEISEIETGLDEKKKIINYKKIQRHSLSDDGIKSNIIREFVPFINSQIQKILSNFDIKLSLYFDAEFKSHIFRLGKEVSIKTISTGQKKILDFAILITMTKILKLKYPDINLIFYDEIFSSIHPNNRIVILDIIDKEIRLGLNMNVVVVSHTHLPESYFQKFVEVYEENSFSRIKITKESVH